MLSVCTYMCAVMRRVVASACAYHAQEAPQQTAKNWDTPHTAAMHVHANMHVHLHLLSPAPLPLQEKREVSSGITPLPWVARMVLQRLVFGLRQNLQSRH